ncbi:hypothetical protein QE364_000117 [Nocardioides zeae]|uniref:Uncharacterized protein n=1 Tax=Nocardioides zeae TaxID=1457234 RepID=A0ACC6ICK4_9ACTN|nr:hypothetical protein [Nocardioides zeae]MDR6175498.1 hypothetical protein [Nocardioides zeae]MDR6208429.1 hypothetical protein [Nocardioides zeae]
MPGSVALLLAGPAALVALPRFFGLPAASSVDAVLAPSSAVAAWFVALAALAVAREPAPDLVLAVPRRAKLTNLGRIAATYGLGIAACLAAGASAAPLVTSSATFLAQGLVVASLTTLELAWVVPTVHLTSAVSLGAAGRADVAPWAWPVMVAPPLATTVAALAAALVGLGAWGWRLRLR